MIQVLVKVRGNKKHLALVHAYDAEKKCAACCQCAPGRDWEVQTRDLESYAQMPYMERCDRCAKKLRPKPPVEKKKKPGRREQRRQAELRRWEKWTGKSRD